MTYANQEPQHSGQNYISIGPSHNSLSRMSPEEQKQAEKEAQLEREQLEAHEKREKARHEKYAIDREKGIFHPGDPQTKIIEITDPAKKGMSRAEQERRIKDGSLPPEFADLHALIERRKDPANQRPPVKLRGFRGPTPQAEVQFKESPELIAQSSVVPHSPDIQQQVLTQKPMQSATDLEAAAIQQHYKFTGPDFARWAVGQRQQDEAIWNAWVAEFRRRGDRGQEDRMDAAAKVGYDGKTHPGTFVSTTPLAEPHRNDQGRFFYNTTLSFEADAYYGERLPGWQQEWMKKVEAERQKQLAEQQQQAQQQAAEQQARQQGQREADQWVAQQQAQQHAQSHPQLSPPSGIALPQISFDHQYVVHQGASPTGAQQAQPQGQGTGAALTPEQRFGYNVANRAQGLLKANYDRLDTEQAQYAQDNNPKSERWQHLWAAASQQGELQSQTRSIQMHLSSLSERIQQASDTPSLSDGLGATPQELQNSEKHRQLEALTHERKGLEEQLRQVQQTQATLNYAYPALAAVQGETGRNPADLQKVQSRIPREFNGIRGNIDTLSDQVAKDPTTALLFDSVVSQQLQDQSMSPQERQEVTEWLKKTREEKAQGAPLGMVASGGLFLASFIPALQEVALPLQVIGAGLSGGMMASEIPDLTLLDRAAQAGRGGQDLTGESPEQAKFNVVMGYTNVVLAGLDVGAEVGVVQKLTKVPGLLSAAGSMTREKCRVLVNSVARHSGAMTDAVLEKLVGAVKTADANTTLIIANGDGSLTQMRPLGHVADGLEETATIRASAKAKKPPKVFEEYANAGSVKPFIGTKVDPNNLPSGYKYGKIPFTDRWGREAYREVVYVPNPQGGEMVPLKVDKGVIQVGKEGDYRIVNKSAYDKNVVTVPGKPGKLLGGDSEIHHLYADNMMRSTTFGQRALELGAVNPDAAINTIELANSLQTLDTARKAHPNVKFSDFVHNTQHPLFDGLMQEVVLKDEIDLVREAKGFSGNNEKFISQMTKEEIQIVWNRSLKRMRRALMGEDKELYIEIKKITRPSGSIAQGQSQDETEVA
jgi:hypothetical protein